MKKTTVCTYRNIRNQHKYIEVHFDGYGHQTVRQFMYWQATGVKNLLGDRCLHRWSKENFNVLLEDYVAV